MKDYDAILQDIWAGNGTRDEKRNRAKAAEAEFRNELESIYAPACSQEQRDILFAKAYADGHYAGYSAIVEHYSDLAEFIVNFNKAANSK